MSNCKNCHSSEVTKNGFVRSKQRYRCKTAVIISGETREPTLKPPSSSILYSLAKASYGTIAKFNVSPSTVQKWRKGSTLLSEQFHQYP